MPISPATPVPGFSSAPAVPNPQIPSTFNALAQSWFAFITAQDPSGANLANLAVNAAANAGASAVNAQSANDAASAAGAVAWSASTNYLQFQCAVSPIDKQTYRRNFAGISSIDPSSDPTNWVKYVINNTQGGAVYTTSTTLTSSSPYAISISGGAGVWIKLPDATTISLGARYHVQNIGGVDVKVIDGGGNTIGFIRPKSSSVISISDASTINGKWCHELECDGIVDDFCLQLTTAALATMRSIVPLDSTRTAYLYGSTNLWLVIYDTATQLSGAPTLIRSAVGYATALKSADNQIVVLSVDNSTYTNLQGVAVGISGTTIGTIPTPTPVTLGSAVGMAWGQSTLVNGSIVTSYYRSGAGAIRPIFVSGGVVTIGAEESLGASYPPRLYVSGAVLRVVYFATNLYCKPYSISGAVLTAGTAASEATSSGAMPEQNARSFILNNFIWVFHGAYSCTIFSLSGTTETKSTVSSLPYISGNIGSNFYYDVSIISNTKVAICGQTDLTNGVVSCNVITNTSGTASAGTASTDSGLSGNFYISETKPYGNSTAFVIHNTSYQYTFLNKYDCSTASPVKSKQGQLTKRVGVIQGAKNQLNQPVAALLFGSSYLIKYRDYTDIANPFNAFCVNSENATPINPSVLSQHPNFRDLNYSVDGESYCITSCGDPSANIGVHIQKIEVAK